MFQYVALVADKEWRPGPYPGVQLNLQAGATVPEHIHPLANEHTYVIAEQWERTGITHGPGSFFFAPGGALHGPHFAKTEQLSLAHFDGPLTGVELQPA